MQKTSSPGEPILNRVILFALYLAGGLLVFFFGSNYFKLLPTNRNAVYEWALTFLLLLVAIALRLSPRFQRYWGAAFALFLAAFVNVFALGFGTWLIRLWPKGGSEMQVLAVDKLSESVTKVVPIIALTLLAGDDLGSIFLKRGKLRQSLTFGLISFGIFAALFIVIAVVQSGGPATRGLTASGISLRTLVRAIPWIVTFCLANGLMEELWFRGISLKRLAPMLGPGLSVVLTALVFAAPHLGASYTVGWQKFAFPVVVFALGWVNGRVMLQTDSIWGSVLFHAGYDLLVIIPVLAAG